jgi:molecular chaperone DnaK (HSP70)
VADNQLHPVVGIDLGTTYSCIARWADDRAETYKLQDGSDVLPSIVYIQDGGVPLVGTYARQRLIIDPPNAVEKIKRHMGDDGKVVRLRGTDYTPVDISALILKRLKDDVYRKYPASSGFSISGAIITHPQYFKYPQIARTQEAAEKAGLPVIRMLSEPVAAALDYGFTQYQGLAEDRSEKLLIFDLGGGTFDVTVLHVINTLNKLTFKVLSVGGDDMLGGTNFDEAFQTWALEQGKIDLDSLDPLARARSLAKLGEQVIDVKKQLSSVDDTFLSVPNILPGKHLDIEVTRDQFNEIIRGSCDRVRGIVSATLARANLRPGELSRTILVGGSSRIPIMRQIVQDETGVEPWANTDPDQTVCRGAAFLAAIDDGRVGNKKEIVIEEITSHALGVRAAGDKFAILIPANRPAPVEATKIFSVNSSSFTVIPYQGNGKLVTEDSVLKLKPIPVAGVQLGPDGKADVRITFSVNDQQILFVKIEAPGVYEQRQMEF